MSVLDQLEQLHRYTVEEYDELVLKGAFEDQRVELIDGLVLDMSPRSEAHELAVRWLHNRWLARHLDLDRYEIGVCGSLRLATSEPEPDIMVIERGSARGHPSTALLVVEVALSSCERDLTIKPRLYAPAVAEYWVLDLERRKFVVHRRPSDDGYSEIIIRGAEAMLRPQRIDLEPLSVDELLRAT